MLDGSKNHFHIDRPFFAMRYDRVAEQSLSGLLFILSQLVIYTDDPVGSLVVTDTSHGTSITVFRLIFSIGLFIATVCSFGLSSYIDHFLTHRTVKAILLGIVI